MTGEITLRGEFTYGGGLKEKLLAAHRGGIKTVLIQKTMNVIWKRFRQCYDLQVIPVQWIDEVLKNR
ncbi:hypothetical protein O9993_19575 [Vibrio lentus]|nr:hypothetical protein [Vibrio lentus]